MITRVVLVAAALAASAAAALAASQSSGGWQFAKWGMTPAKVRAASHGVVKPGESDGGYDVMARQYAMGKFKFDVNFDYMPRPDDPANDSPDNLMLDAVMLNLDTTTGTCADLEAYLKKRYGKPAQTFARGPAGDLWRSKRLGDINYSTWNENKCDVMYMAFGASDE